MLPGDAVQLKPLPSLLYILPNLHSPAFMRAPLVQIFHLFGSFFCFLFIWPGVTNLHRHIALAKSGRWRSLVCSFFLCTYDVFTKGGWRMFGFGSVETGGSEPTAVIIYVREKCVIIDFMSLA